MPRATSTNVDVLSEILGDTARSLAGVFEQVEWAEDEISRAMRRHPQVADTLFHSFCLLTPTHDRMATEFVYRSHGRELLERVAVDADTRPATAAEMCCACSTASQVVPLSPAAAGLYFRMWAQAFPEQPDIGAEHLPHHEALYGSHIDDLETVTRRKLTVHGRKLGKIDCCGLHHGRVVACRHAPLVDPLFDLPATA